MDQFQLTGGARIGMLHASWPFATLTVTNERLDLNASLIGTYSFTPDQIISIEPYGQILLGSWGIRINHTVTNYNEIVIFSAFKDPNEIIAEIKKTGFLDRASSTINQEVKAEVLERQKQGRFPIRVSVAITIALVWIVLVFVDIIRGFQNEGNGFPYGNGILIAIGFLLIVSTLALFSKDFRKYILKEGRDIKEIDKFLYFLILFCGFMLVAMVLARK